MAYPMQMCPQERLPLIPFYARFSSGEGRGVAAFGGHGILHGHQKSQTILLAPHQDGTKQGRRLHLLLPGRPLGRFAVDLISRTCLASLSWGILDT